MRTTFLYTAALIASFIVSGCSSSLAPATAPSTLSATHRSRPFFKSKAPFAYVAQLCPSGSACPTPNGFVAELGGKTITDGVIDPTTLALDSSGNLYVANSTTANAGNVTVYAPQSQQPARTLTGLVGVAHGIAVDGNGRAFVVAQYRSGCCQLEGTGDVYAAGGTQPHKHLHGLSGFAHSPVLDPSGNLYVGNFDVFPGWVSVYPPGKHTPSRTISTGIGLPVQLAIAPNGDLVVANGLFSGGSNVVVYPPGASAPSLTIAAGVSGVTGVAVDAQNNIYVANGGDKKTKSSISVFREGQTTAWRTIQSGFKFPSALAFDGSGRLYVANVPRKGTNTIAVYAAGGSTPIRVYRLKGQFEALAVPQS
ncbi:MAG TPA: hypothetical protein VHX17_10910 [Candidatus Cybelea sp.]|jgi:sugar lactone lactonase YvrE|nr:hypothetical protein [Candidatus Cybelea sp.]